MLKPITNQIISRYQFSAGSENINSKQVAMPRIGISGTSGARNGRLASGFVLRMTITAPPTITNQHQHYARLAQHHHQQNRCDSGHGAERDKILHPYQSGSLERLDDGSI